MFRVADHSNPFLTHCECTVIPAVRTRCQSIGVGGARGGRVERYRTHVLYRVAGRAVKGPAWMRENRTYRMAITRSDRAYIPGVVSLNRFGGDRADQSAADGRDAKREAGPGGGLEPDRLTNRRLVELLSSIVQRSRALQRDGRLQGRSSRAELQLIEHHLKMAKARLAMAEAREAITLDERASAVVILAGEACEAAQATRRVSRAASEGHLRARKRLYRARLINGADGVAWPAGVATTPPGKVAAGVTDDGAVEPVGSPTL